MNYIPRQAERIVSNSCRLTSKLGIANYHAASINKETRCVERSDEITSAAIVNNVMAKVQSFRETTAQSPFQGSPKEPSPFREGSPLAPSKDASRRSPTTDTGTAARVSEVREQQITENCAHGLQGMTESTLSSALWVAESGSESWKSFYCPTCHKAVKTRSELK